MTAAPIRVTDLAEQLLAANPGPMTLDGTNSYVLAAPGSVPTVVVDPGPSIPAHLDGLAARPVDLILVTHRHADHTQACAELAARTGAPVRAADPAFCIDAPPLAPGERIVAAGVTIEVVATPGHTSDSTCFLLADDEGGRGSVLTGDTVLGRGTTILDHPDGRLGDYLASLHRLAALGPRVVLPAHGPVRLDLAAAAGEYLAHREERLQQIRAAVRVLGDDASVDAVTSLVYADVDRSVRTAAERSVAAQLVYLRETD
jgi:glyoxylase-like metal-dependent hydrolase (beta-lactamase superfamily II)